MAAAVASLEDDGSAEEVPSPPSKAAKLPKKRLKDTYDSSSDSSSGTESDAPPRVPSAASKPLRSTNSSAVPAQPETGEPLLHASQEQAEKTGARSWNRPGFHEVLTKGQEAWLKKLRGGDTSGVETPASSFVNLRGEALSANPRAEESYKQGCVDICGLGVGEKFDKERYGHLDKGDLDMLRWAVRRGSSSMWLPDSARTSARGFKH